MIAYLKGTIIIKGDNFIVIEAHDVGYKVFVTNYLLNNCQIDEHIEVYTHHNIKEDSLDLYGFQTQEDLALFQKLISISGVGPKTGLAVFAVASASDIKSAIVNGDSSILKKVSGIGGKTADRIVLELKNKLDGIVGVNIKSQEQLTADTDVLEALNSLGYSSSQAREAIQKIDTEITDTSAKVKAALKYLSK